MSEAAFRKFYIDINFFNVIFSGILGFVLSDIYSTVFGIFWGMLFFCSFGIFTGYFGYNYFKSNQYFLYYNLGYTKKGLVKKVWLYNTLFCSPALIILLLILI